MAKKYNHGGKYGHNTLGLERYRHVQSPDKLFRAIDLADFQYNKGKVGITDVDGCINLGGKAGQINIILEFKEASLMANMPRESKHEAIPTGQRIALENLANGIHMTTAFFNNSTQHLSYRVPGTASMIILVSHTDSWHPSGAEGLVEKVYWANDSFDRTLTGWQDATGEGEPPISLAQYLDALSALLYQEAPEVRAAKLFRGIGKAGLVESGQQSRLISTGTTQESK